MNLHALLAGSLTLALASAVTRPLHAQTPPPSPASTATPLPSTEPAPPTVSRARRGPLFLPYGITFGAGAGLLVGNILFTKSARQDVASIAFTPYVVLAPQYWAGGVQGRECSRQRTGGAQEPPFSACLPFKFGLLVGRPLNYDATSTIAVDGLPEKSRSIRPSALLGLAFLPNAYLTTAVGWTFATTTRDDGTDARLGAITLLAGVNLDALGALW